jgi:hypothetical protein
MKKVLLGFAFLIGSVASAAAACVGPAVMHDFPGTTFNMSLATAPDTNCQSNVALPTWAGGTLGAMANYGTSPGAVLVPGVNAFITNVPTVAQATAANFNATVVGTGTFTTQVNAFTSWAGGTLGAMANYGTSPGAVLAPGVNAFITNTPPVSQSGTWTVQPGNTANTTPWLASISQGGNTAVVKAGNTAAAADVAVAVSDPTLQAIASAATPAGENHIGEIASNQIKVQVAQTVTASSAYAAGNAIGGLQTIAGAARVSGSLGAAGTGGILTGLMMNSKSLQTTQVDVFLFDANPSGSTCTDKTAFSLATADFDKVIGVVTIPGTAANGAGWYAGTVGSTGVATYYPVTYDLASATSIFACAVTRGTPTYTATTDVSFKYNILRN